MAAKRAKRSTAGNRMGKLLDDDEEEFYSTTYGGFLDEEGDVEYTSEEESSDSVDSDFSIEESDELVSEEECENDKHKRMMRVVTKAYKEPEKKRVVTIQETVVEKEVSKTPKTPLACKTPMCKRRGWHIERRKSIRKSTTLKSAQTQQRQIEHEEMKEKMAMNPKKKIIKEHIMTQAELLEEAKQTEIINLKSLETYQQSELERKKQIKTLKQISNVPMIRYHSVVMPQIEEVTYDENGQIELATMGRCSRNFITFPDEKTLREYFPKTKPKPKPKMVCPISQMPARYFDPVTKLPYFNTQEFRIIREAYSQQLAKKGDSRQPDVAAWQKWYQKEKNNVSAAKGSET